MKNGECFKKMADIIKNKEGFNTLINHKGVNEKSRLFCDKIEYIHNRNSDVFDHHLMFWNKGELIFKVWLPNERKDKEFKDVYEALSSVDISVK